MFEIAKVIVDYSSGNVIKFIYELNAVRDSNKFEIGFAEIHSLKPVTAFKK